MEPSFLAPTVNGKGLKEPYPFWQVDGAWVAQAVDWQAMGVELKPLEAGDLSAASLGIELKVNAAAQTAYFDVPADRMPAQSKSLKTGVPSLSPAAPGVLLNYSVAGRVSQNSQAFSFGHEARTAGRWGVLSTSGQANWSSNEGARYVRGSTYWQFDDNKRLITYQAGDVVTGGKSSVALGGFRVARDPKGLNPYSPTYYQPTLGGLALDAATVTVLSNQAQVATHDVTKGPFTVESFPLTPGRSRTQLVVTDAYGRQTILSESSFYFSPSILRKGERTWEFAAGAVRDGFDGYGELGATSAFAYGLTDKWTVQGSAQADKEHHNTTVGVRTTVGLAGAIDAQVGRSSGPTGSGTSLKLSYDYQGPQFSVHAEHERNTNYWELSNLPVEERTRLSASWRNEDNSFSIRGGASSLKTKRFEARYVDLSARFNRGSHTVSAGATYNLATDEPGFDLGYRYQFDRGTMAVRARKAPDVSASMFGSYRTELAGKPLSLQGDVTHRAGEQAFRASAMLTGELVDARVDASYSGGKMAVSGSVSGAVHIGKGGITPLRASSDAFAVIDVPGVAGVPIKVNGRLVGVTDKNGRVVAGQMGSLAITQVNVEDRELPVEVQLEMSEQNVAAKRRSGVHVVFPVKTMNARSFIVKRADGQAIEPGTSMKSENQSPVIGFDGEVFVEQAQPGLAFEVTGLGCSVTLPTPLPTFEAQAELVCK